MSKHKLVDIEKFLKHPVVVEKHGREIHGVLLNYRPSKANKPLTLLIEKRNGYVLVVNNWRTIRKKNSLKHVRWDRLTV
jgi:hypothetical protein